jgi:ATP-dependent DNA helicase RecG
VDAQTIRELIDAGEGPGVEFKSELFRPESLAREIVAFANSQGGVILIGIEDDKRVTGITQPHEMEEKIANISRNNVVPPLSVPMEIIEIDERKVLCLNVPKGSERPYQTNDSKFLLRVGSTNRSASQRELLRLFQAAGTFHFDSTAVDNASSADLNAARLDEYFKNYGIEYSGVSSEEQQRLLVNSDIAEKSRKPTLAGMLIFGSNPGRFLAQSGIAFAHFNGVTPDAPLLNRKMVSGSLDFVIDTTISLIGNAIPEPSSLTGARRTPTSLRIPDRVFRELVVNACVHRNYSLVGAQIRVFVFSDRFEIRSPGRLPNTITLEKLRFGVSFAANPLILKFMDNLGYIERLGRGLPLVWNECRRLGITPEFQEIGDEFRVIIPRIDQ